MNTEKAISFCNRALVDLGEDPIAAFDDGSATATVCDERYESVLEHMLGSARWEFATVQAQLAAYPNAPLVDWSYAYQLPTQPKYLRMVRLADSLDGLRVPTSMVWERSSRVRYTIRTHEYPQGQRNLVLMTDYSSAFVEYIARVEEELFPPTFEECVVVALREKLAMSLTNNADLVKLAHVELYGQSGQAGLLGRAIMVDRTNSPRPGLRDDAGFLSGR